MTRPTTSSELREAFLRFYEERGHLRMGAAPLIPANDPTLLLTNSGMAQFKQYFSGELEPPKPRITTSQKSFRTTDIESVGDATHLTLFEMLGNFSFGDYFKKEACAWALEFMTRVLKFPPERLYFTVYQDDDEAIAIWRDLGVPPDHIYRFGAKDNFWGPAGEEGPCGPCSELHYYGGDLKRVPRADDPVRKSSWGPNLHKDFVELYNLVFTQLYHHSDGHRTELPKKNIDTGMGLERTAAILQGVKNVYEIDVFRPLIARVEELSGKEWGQNPETSRALSVVAEHSRSASFLIGDGVSPGNTGRGYVLRRLIRRAMLFGRRIGLNESFLPELSKVSGEVMGEAYPELVKSGPFITRVLQLEEERFSRTLDQGSALLNEMVGSRPNVAQLVNNIATASPQPWTGTDIQKALERVPGLTAQYRSHPGGQVVDVLHSHLAAEASQPTATVNALHAFWQGFMKADWSKSVTGYEAAYLYDTFGFPMEITKEIAGEHGLGFNEAGFKQLMERQRERGRAAGAKFGGDMAKRHVYEELGVDETPFVGYHATSADSVVVGIIRGGEVVQSAHAGEQVEVVLRETPFYAEQGGQVGDAGKVSGPSGVLHVTDTQNPYARVRSHFGTVASGQLGVGDTVRAEVDVARRERIRRNHTATHLLHAALREVLGEHVRQAGSHVAPDRLRFDYTHVSALTPTEMRKVQDRVNEQVRANTEVKVEHTTYSTAVQKGALAFFGDKYENDVRAVCIVGVEEHKGHDGPGHGQHKHECWSYELCGGTHMDRTGGIGAIVITSENGIGAGLRRIEAATGAGAEELIWERFAEQEKLAALLRVPVTGALARVEALSAELDSARKKVVDLEDKLLKASLGEPSVGSGSGRNAPEILPVQVGPTSTTVYIFANVPATDTGSLRRAGDHLRDQSGRGIQVLGSVIDGQPRIVVMASQELHGTAVHSGKIANVLASMLDGRGGGTQEVGQGGGRDASKLPGVLSRDVVKRAIEQTANQSENN